LNLFCLLVISGNVMNWPRCAWRCCLSNSTEVG
jgi:hypothetical protein